jgi:predicted enzyme related to lactoylglutathione lyase
MANALNWFEIPSTDLDRAIRFYEMVLEVRLTKESFAGTPMAVFPSGHPADIYGALIQTPKRKPSVDGALIYLNATGKLEACLERIPRAGGAVLMPKTDIGEPGFIAIIRDTEGNSVGLHAPR